MSLTRAVMRKFYQRPKAAKPKLRSSYEKCHTARKNDSNTRYARQMTKINLIIGD